MKQIRIYVTLILIICSSSLFSQKAANIWYFGNQAGLDFNSGTPVALTNSAMAQYEGCSSIADVNGNLQFYSDGATVWNRNHVPMPNGIGLLGNSSSSQSALIIPKPGNSTLYYLFTADFHGAANGLQYSIIDMTLQGGTGDISSKNNPVYTPIAEKVTAAWHSNGTDVWIITHEFNTNAFLAFLLTSSGLSSTPVISNAGAIHGPSVYSTQGYMKTSPDGTKLAVAIDYSNMFELFDFDKTTGTVSSPITFNNYARSYGVEFSPDNSKLYGTLWGGPSELWQWDLLAGSSAAILASAVQIVTYSNTYELNAMQLGPDGKIYIARNGNTNLGVINSPNSAGTACNYSAAGINLGGKTSALGLPNFMPGLFSSVSVQNLCFGDSTVFSISSSGLIAAQWNFDDTASGVNNVAYTYAATHYFIAPGTYSVQLIKYNAGGFVDTSYTQVTINSIPVVTLGNDTTFCTGANFLLNAGSGFTNYLWQDGSTNSTFSASVSGNYSVTVKNGTCSASDTISLNTVTCSIPLIGLASSDSTFCDKQSINFFDLSTNNPTSWHWYFPGAVPDTSTMQNPTGIFYANYGSFDVALSACNIGGCDSLFLTAFIKELQNPPTPTVTQSGDTLLSSTSYSYQWFEINNPTVVLSTASSYVTNQPGSYYVLGCDSLGCCSPSNVIIIAGIKKLGKESGIFPNPNNGIFILKMGALSANEITIVIYNYLGEKVFTTTERNFNGTLLKEIDLSSQRKGIYLVKIEAGKNEFQTKLMKD